MFVAYLGLYLLIGVLLALTMLVWDGYNNDRTEVEIIGLVIFMWPPMLMLLVTASGFTLITDKAHAFGRSIRARRNRREQDRSQKAAAASRATAEANREGSQR